MIVVKEDKEGAAKRWRCAFSLFTSSRYIKSLQDQLTREWRRGSVFMLHSVQSQSLCV